MTVPHMTRRLPPSPSPRLRCGFIQVIHLPSSPPSVQNIPGHSFPAPHMGEAEDRGPPSPLCLPRAGVAVSDSPHAPEMAAAPGGSPRSGGRGGRMVSPGGDRRPPAAATRAGGGRARWRRDGVGDGSAVVGTRTPPGLRGHEARRRLGQVKSFICDTSVSVEELLVRAGGDTKVLGREARRAHHGEAAPALPPSQTELLIVEP
ncbi:PREDICTED: translation initiation factor IF-2-like [Calidris pugnax]|uniref:translation initiation factor IF-2-like n=1 Tax=Calidris pugnax TaxID=198806 RepID=UPI00071E59B6|nr:PREDICTED: translation initiation factor IF-2-like [Calidris pugnax]